MKSYWDPMEVELLRSSTKTRTAGDLESIAEQKRERGESPPFLSVFTSIVKSTILVVTLKEPERAI